MATDVNKLICAGCQGEGKSACKNCLLVLYCGGECQKNHWPKHKLDCNSPLNKDSWTPRWDTEQRTPQFKLPGCDDRTIAGNKSLWGNVPALDILKLGDNEGLNYSGELQLLFAASGDLRNVIQTIVSMPENYAGSLSMTINDCDFIIVARNTILLLVAFVADTPEQAADCMIHLWYSAGLTEAHIELLRGPVRQRVERMCSKIAHKSASWSYANTWRFGSRSLRLVLTKNQWFALLRFLDIPDGLTSEQAQVIRKTVTLAHERRDYLDRSLIWREPAHRLCVVKFREDGILLPFGHSRADFVHPNPTLFQTDDWPLKDLSDPFHGWSYTEVYYTECGPAENDLYGKLFRYLHGLFTCFYRRIRSLTFSAHLYNALPTKLDDHLADNAFARVEVSNIADTAFVGPVWTIAFLSRFLQPPSINPHATMITLFMNAVEEHILADHAAQPPGPRYLWVEELYAGLRFMPDFPFPWGLPNSPAYVNGDETRYLARDGDKYFEQFMSANHFNEIQLIFGVVIKDPHTIIDEWPMRLDPGTRAQWEFKLLRDSAHTGTERYVEWKKDPVDRRPGLPPSLS